MVRPTSVKFHWNGLSKSLWINPAMDVEELRKTLCAAFGLPDESIDGVFVADNGRSFGLEKVCESPSSFGGYTGIHIILNDEDEDDDEDEEDDEDDEEEEEEEEEEERPLDWSSMFAFDSHDIASLMRMFAEYAPSGHLDKATFSRCFQHFLKSGYRGDPQMTGKLLARLFQVFDRDGNGVVDAKEFLSGLTVLCSGSRDEKIRLAFNLYDEDGDGFISKDEMTRYLSSVFAVVEQNSNKVFATHGVTPYELAAITANQCFEECDLNRDGKLSYQEFKQWYSSSQGQGMNSLVVRGGATPATGSNGGMSLAALSQSLGFNEFTAEEVFDIFAEFSVKGNLNRTQFRKAYYDLVDLPETAEMNGQLNQLFAIFDTDENDLVDFEELASGLSILCSGSRDDKVRAVFSLYDVDGDNYITYEEMVSYMTSVFRLLYSTSHDVQTTMAQVDPEQLAELTARQAFLECDMDQDGRLSFEEFKMWYSKPSPQKQATIADPSSLSSKGIGLEQVRALTGIGKFDIFTVFDEFAHRVDNDGTLSWDGFQEAFAAIREMSGAQKMYNDVDPGVYYYILRRLFELFDVDQNGSVDFSELASGLGVLCKATQTPDEKVRATFSLFDMNGDGFISPDEMERYMTAVFRVIFEVLGVGAIERAGGLSPEELARLTTSECFMNADTNQDGRLSFAEFSKWYLSDDDGSAIAAIDDHRVPPMNQISLAETKAITGLDRVPIEDLFDLLSVHVDVTNVGEFISKQAFKGELGKLAPRNANRDRLSHILDRIFRLFAIPQSQNVAVFPDLIGALSILCQGSQHEKAEVAFQLYDFNNDNFISFPECCRYLTAVFAIMFELEPTISAKANGLKPAELAQVTAQSIFEEADLNNDNRLSFDEFKAWYTSSSGGGGGGGVNTQGVTSKRDPSSSWMSIAEVRRLTALDKYSPEEAFEILAEVANDDGLLDKSSFFRAFHRIVSKQGGIEDEQDLDRLRLVLHRLFDTFDVNKDGFVDFAELSSGISILCGGDRHDKAEAAFQLFDVNGDGYVDMDEMERYLTCVFKVMYQTNPETKQQVNGATPEELAHSTAYKIFMEADVNHDGLLNFAEFKAWYSKETGQQLSVAADLMAADSNWFNISEIQRLTRLHRFNTEELFKLFAEAAQEDPEDSARHGRLKKRASTSGMFISRESFDEVMQDLIDEDACATEDDFVRLTFILDRLYDMFDANNDGRVDFNELASGLSVLSGGDIGDKIANAFALYDENGDGFISLQEMTKYLTALFMVLLETRPELRQEVGEELTAQQLAAATAEEVFIEADLNDDGLLSFDEFQRWYNNKPSAKAFTTIVESAPEFVSMKEIRELTKIDRYAAEDVVDQIRCFANDRGEIDKRGFLEAFYEIITEADSDKISLDPSKAKRLEVVLNRLFDIFDLNKDGVVDSRELNAGLSILCGDDRDSKAETAFDLFDLDGNGAISLEEMTRYLTSVFKIMYQTNEGMEAQVGAPAEELARATADQIFVDSDLNQDGELNFEEFRKWYSTQDGKAINNFSHDIIESLSLDQIRQLTRFNQYTPSEVFEMFAEFSPDGVIDRHSFERCFKDVALRKPPPLTSAEMDRLHLIIHRLFDAFSEDGHTVDFTELASGLSVICGGTKDTRAESAFALYDTNGDGFISEEELYTYLLSVFRVMFQLQPEAKRRMGSVDPEVIADATTKQIFSEADLNHDGKLSFNEFKSWYDNLEDPNRTAAPPSRPPQMNKQTSFEEDSPKLLLADARRLSGLSNMEPTEAFEEFAMHANEAGELDRESFERVFAKIIRRNVGHKLTPLEAAQSQDIVEQLFNLFDQNSNGVVDFIELASGLSVLCGGTSDAKAEAVFRLYDHDGTGFVSKESMEWFLTSVFRLMYEQPGTKEKMGGLSPEELASVTTEQIFRESDLNHDGQLSFDEFKKWYGEPNGSAAAVNAVVEQAPSLISMEEIRRITGLGEIDQRDVFEEFAMAVDDDGLLGPAEFRGVFAKLIDLRRLSPIDKERLPLILERLFEIFDNDHSGKVDFSELAAGLSIFCKTNSRDEKARAAFSLYDEDEDGYVTMEELTSYLTSVYKVMYETAPNVRQQADGLSPEQLAEQTALEIFDVADANNDGKLSFDEFRQWYSSDDRVSPGFDRHHEQQQQQTQRKTVINAVPVNDEKTSPDWLSLDEVRRITGFEKRDVHALFEEFASYTNNEGVLNRAAFNEAFDKLTSSEERSESDLRKLEIIKRRMFDIFDVNMDGVVDFSEVASGLTVLCKGTKDAKTAAVFSLYDYDQDGFIDKEEMERYLTCIFKVLMETEPDSACCGIPPEALAKATTEEIFAESDLNHDGRLSFEEFQLWYSSGGSGLPGGSDIAKSVNILNDQALHTITIDEARRLTGLGQLTTNDVYQEFALVTDDEGIIDRQSYFSTFKDIVSRTCPLQSRQDKDKLQLVLQRLYDVLATERGLDFSELACGLSILCKGDRQDKVRSAFALFDINQDNYIEESEMETYLRSVFKVLYELIPGTKERVNGVTPEELAEITAAECLNEADLDNDGRLSFEEFEAWFSGGNADFLQPVMNGGSGNFAGRPATSTSPLPPPGFDQPPSPATPMTGLSEIKRLTKLENLTVNEVLDSIKSMTDSESELDFETFVKVFELLIEQAGGHESYRDQEAASAVIRQLFQLFDSDQNGTIDYRELASGLSILCLGSREDKVKTMFNLYDANQDGVVSLEEMSRYLSAVFKVLFAAQPEYGKMMGITPEQLGVLTAEQAFVEADSDQDGFLSYDEFKAWYEKQG